MLTNVPTCVHASPQRGHRNVDPLFGGSLLLDPLPAADFSDSLVVVVELLLLLVVVVVGGLSLPFPLPSVGGRVGGFPDESFDDLQQTVLACTARFG